MTPEVAQAKITQVHAALEIIRAVAGAIQGLGEIPSGHLYAMLMGKLSFESYNAIIERIKAAGLIEETPAHLLVWKGVA